MQTEPKQEIPAEPKANVQEDPEKRVAVHIEGWGESSFFYESKPRAGERKKTDFSALVEQGKQEKPKKPDYKALRIESIHDSIEPKKTLPTNGKK